MQPVIWVVQFKDRSQIREIDENGVETVFNEQLLARKSEFAFIGLLDLVNNVKYSINLLNGRLVLGGQEYSPCKEVGGRIFKVSEIPKMVYNEGVIQYKVSKPVFLDPLNPEPVQSAPAMFNIGYKAQLPDDFLSFKYRDGVLKYSMCQVLLSIDADTMNPSISTTFTSTITKPDGSVEHFKI